MVEMDLKSIAALAVLLLASIVILTYGGKVTYDLSEDLTNYTTWQVNNETYHGNSSSAYTLQNYPVVSGSVAVTNATGGETVPSNNYSVALLTGAVTTETTSAYNNSNLNISYQYNVTTQSVAYNNSINAMEGQAAMGEQYPTLGLVIIAAIIVTIISVSFGGYL